MDKQRQIEELKNQIEILKQQLYDKEVVLDGLLNMLDKDSDENDGVE